MGGQANVLRGIRHFGPRRQIGYVHFRDVQGTGDQFAECFIGEGNFDVTAVMRALKEVGFTGCLIDDHVPHMVGDEGWAPRGRAYATGYLMGLLRAVNDLA
jgi:mannonate dehydratase